MEFYDVDAHYLNVKNDVTAEGTPDLATSGNPFGTVNANTFHVLTSITAGAGTPDLGTVGSPFGTLYGEATYALWGDLAEKYRVKEFCDPGTVMCVSKETEFDVELCDQDLCTSVVGVISTQPGLMMGNKLEGGQYVALTGLVPVQVIGPIQKSDFIVPAGNGCARAGKPEEIAYKIGVANGSDDSADCKLVDCIIK